MNQNLNESEKQLMYHKKSPEIFLKPFLKALSYFPELHNTYIFIRETPFYGVQHTLRSYPPLVTLHWRKSKWAYPIVINKNKNINVPFHTLTFDQQVGFLVHELSHTSYYINFNRREIVKFAIKYAFNKNFVKKIEKETDLRVIEKGGGIYLFLERIFLLDWRKNNPYPETEDTYITPIELIENMKKYPNLYSKKEIEMYTIKLKEIKEEIYSPSHISISRKIKHSLKTILGFVPGFFLMFYIITIKKVHLE